jgi:DNA recombination protein RmuC
MSISTAVLSLSAVFLILGTVLFFWLRSQLNQLKDGMARPVQDSLLDLTERITRMSSEAREVMTDRLGRHFLETQERIDRTLGQNRAEMQSGLGKTTQALEVKFQSLEQQVGLRLETIGKNVEAKLNENIKEGFKHFEKVQEHLKAAELKLQSLNTVGQSISDLNSLLKLPHLRGGFGEATLERLLADFLPIGSFELQYQIVPHSTERVDAVVKLARQILPIDSKFPREQVLPLFESQEPGALEAARKTLAEWVKGQAKQISEKYIQPGHGTTDMAMLFLPSETLYFEVVRNGKLFEDMTKLKVFPVSPNTLAIGLRSVVMAQEYYDMSRGVEQTIEDVTKARRHFDNFGKKFEEVGKGLKKAQDAFETANFHLGRYQTSVYRLTGGSEGELPSLPESGPAGAEAQPALLPLRE